MEKSNGLCVSTHPLIAHKMTVLRNVETRPHDFRRLLREITFYLGYEATRELHSMNVEITTPMNVTYTGSKISDKIAIIPILRAGLGMVDALSDLLPSAAVHHIGMYKAKNSSLPVQYYNRLPKQGSCDIAYICDISIETATTILAVISIVKKWGAKRIIIIATCGSEMGVGKVLQQHPDVKVVIGALDKNLNADGYALPGIGDAGDRLFGTPIDEDHPFLAHNIPIDLGQTEESQMHAQSGNGRKRSLSIAENSVDIK
eukprot:gene8074-16569_t